MKKAVIATAACIILVTGACNREGRDAAGSPVPGELFQTWSLYRDCPNNAITFRKDGSFEFMECYSDDRGEEKADLWTGTFTYGGESDIKVRRPSGAVDIYRLEGAGAGRVLKSGGFTFHPAQGLR